MTGNLRDREDGGQSSSTPLVFVPEGLQKEMGWETVLKSYNGGWISRNKKKHEFSD